MGYCAVRIGAFYIKLHALAAPAEEQEALGHLVSHYQQAVAALKLALKVVAAVYAAMRPNPAIVILKAFQRINPCQLWQVNHAVLNNGINAQSGMGVGLYERLEPAGLNAQPFHLGLEVGALVFKLGGRQLEALHFGRILSCLGFVLLHLCQQSILVAVQPLILGLKLMQLINGTASECQQ